MKTSNKIFLFVRGLSQDNEIITNLRNIRKPSSLDPFLKFKFDWILTYFFLSWGT